MPKDEATLRARAHWAVWPRRSLLTARCGDARRSLLAIRPNALSRDPPLFISQSLRALLQVLKLLFVQSITPRAPEPHVQIRHTVCLSFDAHAVKTFLEIHRHKPPMLSSRPCLLFTVHKKP